MIQRDMHDPKGLIHEAYRIEGITLEECRSIFLDWALSLGYDDHIPSVEYLLTLHGANALSHPMTKTLTAALAETAPAKRRGGRAGRLAR